jgi:D-alanyl-D-alanine endopeptidase (penicillin-binding protein 7)
VVLKIFASLISGLALSVGLVFAGAVLAPQAAWADDASASSPAPQHAKKKAVRKTRLVAAARVPRRAAAPAVPSFGQIYGLHAVDDPLDLKSSVALVLDQDTNEVLLSKNPQAVLPIASITKLMTGLLIVEAQQPMDEKITITQDDRDTEKGTGSRLAFGTTLTREELLHLALMSSENRAAHALARNYPGGLDAFIPAMNRKAQELGMVDTHYVEPTGLSSHNQSSAEDLARLVKVAELEPVLREFTTSKEASFRIGRRQMAFHSTNGLVREGKWDIGLQKTGFINEAGKCLVMQAKLAGRKLIMVFLDTTGARTADPERVRRWLDSNPAVLSREPKIQ